MRCFKKVSAIVLVVAMLFSMMSIGVFAETASTKFVLKYGDDVNTTSIAKTSGFSSIELDVYYSSADGTDVNAGGCNLMVAFDNTNLSAVEIIPNKTDYTGITKQGNLSKGQVGCYFSVSDSADAQVFKADKKMATLKFTFDASKIASLTSFSVSVNKATGVKEDCFTDEVIDTTSVPMTITFTDPLQASAVTTTIPEITKPYGTAQKDLGLIPAVDVSTVLQSDGTTPGNPKTNVAVDWSNATYDPYATDDQNLVGTLITTDPVGFKVDGITVTQKVKHSPIAYTATEPVATAKVKAFKEDKTDDSDGSKAVKEALADKNKIALTVKDGATEEEKITDEITVDWANATVAWDASGNIKTVGSTATVTYTFAADTNSTNGYYKAASGTAVTAKVTVVPAEISGGAISINNPIDNGYVTANITVPASEIAKMPLDAEGDSDEVKAEKKAKRTISLIVPNADSTKEGATVSVEVTPEEIAAANEADAKDLNVTLKSDKKMKDLGYSSSGANKTFTVNVTVGGTKLLNGDSKDAVTGEVKKASSSSAGGIHKGGPTTTTYAVTVVETKNGTATVSPEKAASGATVTVKAEPAEGYKVKSVTAVKADGTNVPVDEKALTFTMPASAVKVTVEFEEGKDEPSVDPTPAEDKFADVADDFWAAKDIYTLKDAGIIGGKSATEFDPEGDVTRAEFAKMVVGLFGYKATSDAVNFEDCKAEDWFTPYVAAGVEAGVIKGVSDTEFAPNATITREDACTILGRALNKVAQSNELKFTDADKVAEYAAPYVALLSELGYVNGYEDGSFAPANNITRAEAAKIIAGIYNAKNTTVTEDKTDAADTTDANVEGENTTAPVEENAEDKADTTDTIDVEPEK